MGKKQAQAEVSKSIRVHTIFSQFRLPPVRDALIVGKKAPIGPNALHRSLEVLMPGQFKLLSVNHPTIEAVIVRFSDLRKIPEDKFIPLLIESAEAIMDESDCLRVDVEVEFSVTQEVKA